MVLSSGFDGTAEPGLPAVRATAARRAMAEREYDLMPGLDRLPGQGVKNLPTRWPISVYFSTYLRHWATRGCCGPLAAVYASAYRMNSARSASTVAIGRPAVRAS